MARYALGIDLGTTNSALAVAPLDEEAPLPAMHPVPQVVHAGEVGERELLPSFLYLPGEVELPKGATALPWDPDRAYVAGAFARSRPTASISGLMSDTVTRAPRRAIRKAMSPVPPAMSRIASPARGRTSRTKRSFHKRCCPPDMRSFITS